MQIINPLPDHTEYYFVSGDPSLKEFAFSRSYVKFEKYNDVIMFRNRFDGYVFLDSKGDEYPAIVELAPFQKMFRRTESKQIKKDLKKNTILDDPDYKQFVEELEKTQNSTAAVSSLDCLWEQIRNKKDNKENEKSTPLIEFLNKKHEARQKMREELKKKKEERKKNDAKKKVLQRESESKNIKPATKERKPKETVQIIKQNVKPSNTSNAKPNNKANDVKSTQASSSSKAEPSKNEPQVKKPESAEIKPKDPKKIHKKERPSVQLYKPKILNRTVKPESTSSEVDPAAKKQVDKPKISKQQDNPKDPKQNESFKRSTIPLEPNTGASTSSQQAKPRRPRVFTQTKTYSSKGAPKANKN